MISFPACSTKFACGVVAAAESPSRPTPRGTVQLVPGTVRIVYGNWGRSIACIFSIRLHGNKGLEIDGGPLEQYSKAIAVVALGSIVNGTTKLGRRSKGVVDASDSREGVEINWSETPFRSFSLFWRFYLRSFVCEDAPMDFLPSAFRLGGRDRVKSLEDGGTESTYQQPFAPTSQAMVRPISNTVLFPLTRDKVAGEDKLANFRLLVGIHSTRTSGPTHGSLPRLDFDGRAAPNLGMYNRVVHREQQAKRSYKFASVMINSCLGVQIVVAAALTALGAANSSHRAVTAFGAINTVIAGMLTYLKGSGLPNRIRYYENEWKRVREYIEQRERDFSRPDCNLDVYEIVSIIEAMYEEVKTDVQTNTPDSYISVGDIRARGAASTHPIPKIPQVNNMANTGGEKLHELELKYGPKITDFLGGLARKEEDRLRQFGSQLQEHKNEAARHGEQLEKGFEAQRSRIVELEKDVEKEAAERRDHVSQIGREIKDELSLHRRE